MAELSRRYRKLTGRPFPLAPVPGAVLRNVGRFMDVLSRIAPVESVLTAEGMTLFTRWVPTDDRLVVTDLGVEWRDLDETLIDTIGALRAAGRLSDREVGRLASG